MGKRSFTRYYRDPQFKAAVDEQFSFADEAHIAGTWITYAVHDPTRKDAIGARPEGPVIYVGQTKEFPKRIRKRMRDAGTAVRRPRDRIDGACYDIMCRGGVPKFTVLEHVTTAIDSLISETNWTKKLRAAGYNLLNQWTEQKFGGRDIDRHSVPLEWLWPLTVSDAMGSGIDLIVSEPATGLEIVADLQSFPPNTRLRDVRILLKAQERRARLVVR
jgi:hypothetical protein